MTAHSNFRFRIIVGRDGQVRWIVVLPWHSPMVKVEYRDLARNAVDEHFRSLVAG